MAEPSQTIVTVGHSTYPIDRFLLLLRRGGVRAIADVRRFPGSRRNPQFGAAALGAALAEAGIAYEPFGDELGGRRAPSGAAEGGGRDNSAWRNASFRAYADHMGSREFAAGLERLEALARERRSAIMCAESDPRRCHRQLIADALLARGWSVFDLLADGGLVARALNPHVVIEGGSVSYPGQPKLDV